MSKFAITTEIFANLLKHFGDIRTLRVLKCGKAISINNAYAVPTAHLDFLREISSYETIKGYTSTKNVIKYCTWQNQSIGNGMFDCDQVKKVLGDMYNFDNYYDIEDGDTLTTVMELMRFNQYLKKSFYSELHMGQKVLLTRKGLKIGELSIDDYYHMLVNYDMTTYANDYIIENVAKLNDDQLVTLFMKYQKRTHPNVINEIEKRKIKTENYTIRSIMKYSGCFSDKYLTKCDFSESD